MEEPSELPEDNDFEVDETQPSVAVAPNPVMNGTTAHQPQQPSNMVNKVVTEKYTVSTPMNNMMGGVNRRLPYSAPKQKELDDQDFLEKMNLKAEADDYQLQITRNLPSCNADGDQVPCGAYSKHLVPVMTYESLKQEITDAWGGGKYRVTFVDQGGRRAADVDRCINIEIPTTQYPPKREKFEKIEPVRATKTVTVNTPDDPSTEEAKRRKREYDEQLEESRRQDRLDDMEQKKAEREFKKLKREKEIEAMRRVLLEPPKDDSKSIELQMLEKRLDEEKRAREEAARKAEEERKERDRKYEDDKKEAQRRAEDDRRVFMEGLTRVTEKLTEVANRPSPPKDNTMEVVLAAMAPVLAAMVNKPPAPLPDPTPMLLEMNKMQVESQKSNMQLMTTIMAKPPDDGSAKMIDNWMRLSSKDSSKIEGMMDKLFAALLSKDKGQVLTPETMLALQDKMEQRFERIMNLGQPNVNQGGEDGEGGYDPALGFLGNTGKALFGSLKALMDSAATNPALLDLVSKVIGSRNPTDQQLMYTAQQWDQNGIPPALMQPQQRPQLQYQPIPAAIPFNPQQQPQMTQSQPQQQVRPMPPPMQPANPAPAVNAQQQAVASELEGGATGIPSNGDPEPQRVMTPEEEAEENLREAVTTTVGIMIGEITGKPPKRAWPEDATDHWNAAFTQQVVSQFDGNARMQLIATKCDPEKMQQLVALLKHDPYEQDILWAELRRFVAMNTKQPVAQVQPVPPIAPPVVNPAAVAPPTANPVQ